MGPRANNSDRRDVVMADMTPEEFLRHWGTLMKIPKHLLGQFEKMSKQEQEEFIRHLAVKMEQKLREQSQSKNQDRSSKSE